MLFYQDFLFANAWAFGVTCYGVVRRFDRLVVFTLEIPTYIVVPDPHESVFLELRVAIYIGIPDDHNRILNLRPGSRFSACEGWNLGG